MLLDYGLADSLMGRFERIVMPHWSYPEMGEAGLGEFRKQFKDAKALIVGEGVLKAEEFLQMKPEMLF